MAQDIQYRSVWPALTPGSKDQPLGEPATRELRRQAIEKPRVLEDGSLATACGVLRLSGEDVNLRMVDRGLAWNFKRDQDEQSPSDRAVYTAGEGAC